jgi:hypothetical protein
MKDDLDGETKQKTSRPDKDGGGEEGVPPEPQRMEP